MVQEVVLSQRMSKEQHFIQLVVMTRAKNSMTPRENNVAAGMGLLNHDPIRMCW